MSFLKKLFGSGGMQSADKSGMYFYVKPHGCQEVVRVRIDMNNDPSLNDDSSAYFVIKTVRGTTYKCTGSAELHLAFDLQRRVTRSEVTGGALVTQAEYEAWVSANPNP
jgi:hypothetical protein